MYNKDRFHVQGPCFRGQLCPSGGWRDDKSRRRRRWVGIGVTCGHQCMQAMQHITVATVQRVSGPLVEGRGVRMGGGGKGGGG